MVSDAEPKTLTSTFTLDITNAAPRLVSGSPPPDLSLTHGKSLSMPLSSYFADDDLDELSLVATYSFNGGAALPIPGGIFSVGTPPMTLLAQSTTSNGLNEVGTYTIEVVVSDSKQTVSTSYKLTVTNSAPRVVNTPANENAGFNIKTSVDVGQYFIDDDGDSM